MSFSPNTEHFITLFDQGYLPQGLCLHHSLEQHAENYHLWVLCMDEEVENSLKTLNLPNLSIIPLREAENDELRRVKPTRSQGEYCWTMTPFTPQMVFDRAPEAKRATYLDADLYFFSSPQRLLNELDENQKDVLITEHAYAPEYDQSETSGIYCVQFMTFNNNEGGRKVMKWWQDRCIEWCFARQEDGKFGDQKYLDDWPERFGDEVHVLADKSLTLAPWNAKTLFRRDSIPVLYHMHGLRVLENRQALLFETYKIGKARPLYDSYVSTLTQSVNLMGQNRLKIIPQRTYTMTQRVKLLVKRCIGRSVTQTLR